MGRRLSARVELLQPELHLSLVPAAERGNLNLAQFCSRKIDAEIANAQAKQLANPEVASEHWAMVDHDVVDHALWVPLVTPISLNFFSKRTGNYQVSPQRNVLLDQLWVR